jgi:hypothetical protein
VRCLAHSHVILFSLRLSLSLSLSCCLFLHLIPCLLLCVFSPFHHLFISVLAFPSFIYICIPFQSPFFFILFKFCKCLLELWCTQCQQCVFPIDVSWRVRIGTYVAKYRAAETNIHGFPIRKELGSNLKICYCPSLSYYELIVRNHKLPLVLEAWVQSKCVFRDEKNSVERGWENALNAHSSKCARQKDWFGFPQR